MRDFNYLSIGHNWEGHWATWVLQADNINVSDMDEFYHDDLARYDYKGRIDYDTKQISIVSDWYDEEKLKYLLRLLRQDYPDYDLWLFGKGLPKNLT
jgi:hypothetical protein